MAKWKTTRGWGHDPELGSDRESAFSFKITDGHDEKQMTVEWAAGGVAGSERGARDAVARYLDENHPPRRLLVDRDGIVHIAEP